MQNVHDSLPGSRLHTVGKHGNSKDYESPFYIKDGVRASSIGEIIKTFVIKADTTINHSRCISK